MHNRRRCCHRVSPSSIIISLLPALRNLYLRAPIPFPQKKSFKRAHSLARFCLGHRKACRRVAFGSRGPAIECSGWVFTILEDGNVMSGVTWWRRVLIGGLLVAMLSLAGCGGSDNSAVAPENPVPPPPPQEKAAKATSSTELP
jgi:hypothetical protein